MTAKVYALYNRRCGHVIATAGTRDYFRVPIAHMQASGHPTHDFRIRVATVADFGALMAGVRCSACTFDTGTADAPAVPSLLGHDIDSHGLPAGIDPSGQMPCPGCKKPITVVTHVDKPGTPDGVTTVDVDLWPMAEHMATCTSDGWTGGAA